MALEKQCRDQIISQLWREDRLSLEEIGQKFGLSRERIRQIVASLGLEILPRPCVCCLADFTPQVNSRMRCDSCSEHAIETRAQYEAMQLRQAEKERRERLGVRVCSGCGEEKHVNQFYVKNHLSEDSKDYYGLCKKCDTARIRTLQSVPYEQRADSTNLNARQCKMIRHYLDQKMYTQAELARMFDVSQTVISQVHRFRPES